MNTYSQNKEDLFVLNYFGDYKGTLLEIGANQGEYLSNSKLLIEHNWEAHLVEPGETYNELSTLHMDNKKVKCHNIGIGENDFEIIKFYESGAHVPNGTDKGLVSTANFEETKRWPEVQFTERDVRFISWDNFYTHIGKHKFDFISIDTEGNDWKILQQIDLEAVGCKVICLEWNGNNELFLKFSEYFKGYKLGFVSGENLIFCK